MNSPIGAGTDKYYRLEYDGSVQLKHAVYYGKCTIYGTNCESAFGTWFADGDEAWQAKWYTTPYQCSNGGKNK